jgi:hypothetical protein
MLKPPSEYVLTKINLVSQPAKIDNLAYDRAIILFTPKVADKGIDLASLTCTIVQITDRGEWGKEEESFTVDASSPNNRKRREFDMTTDAEYSLKIIPPPGLRMGILEIYFDPTIYNEQVLTMAQFNNPAPAPTDLSPLVNAIQAGSAAQIAAVEEAAATENRQIVRLEDDRYSPVPWSGSASEHVAIYPDPQRGSVSIFNPTSERIAVDLFLDLAGKSTESQHDGFLEPGGIYTLDSADAFQGVLLYTLNGSKPGDLNIDLGYYTTAPIAAR